MVELGIGYISKRFVTKFKRIVRGPSLGNKRHCDSKVITRNATRKTVKYRGDRRLYANPSS